MQWIAFQYKFVTYDLSHLHPCIVPFERSATAKLPAVTFNVNVSFSLHCFTHRIEPGSRHDRLLEYSDPRETRCFNFERYELSKRLPEIIRSLDKRKCLQTSHTNYFSIDTMTAEGQKVEYDVFFQVRKPGKGMLDLFVESAYKRERPGRPKAKTIGFLVILHKTMAEQQIKA